jgi:hypothetical protein
MKKAVNDPEVLETLYWHEGLSMWRIAQRLDCSETTVYRKMREYGIDRRSAAARRDSGEPQQNPIYLRNHESGYVVVHNNYDGDKYRCYLHQLVNVANSHDPHKVFSQDYHTHHKNGIPWDNRPENLELLTAEEHMRHHAEDNELGFDTEYTEKELLEWIRSFVAEFGYVPAYGDIEGWPGPDVETYRYRFGTWQNAVNLAGWETPNHPTDAKGRRVGYEEPIQYEED